jgi:hypothetical protein
MFSYRTLYVTSEHYVVLPRMYLMGSYFETGALGKVGVRSARQGAGSASTGADATVRIGGLASWPQRPRTDATVRMVLWMVRGPCGEEAGRVMRCVRCVASARASRGTATRVGSGFGSIAAIAPDHGLSGHGHNCGRHLLSISPLEEVRGRLCVHDARPRSE